LLDFKEQAAPWDVCEPAWCGVSDDFPYDDEQGIFSRLTGNLNSVINERGKRRYAIKEE
jgi:hypothetical protein